MTELEMLDDLKTRLGEPTPAMFTPAVLKLRLNTAQQVVAPLIPDVDADPLLSTSSINTTAATETVAVPTGFLRPVRITYKNKTAGSFTQAQRISVELIGAMDTNSLYLPSDSDKFYYVLGATIGLRPVPTDSVTAGVVCTYVKAPANMTTWTAGATSVIPLPYHDAVVTYAEYECLMQLGEGDKAIAVKDRFDRYFPAVDQKANADRDRREGRARMGRIY